MKPQKLQPGHVWAECVCSEIHPSDLPCIVCEARYGTIEAKRRCRKSRLPILMTGVNIPILQDDSKTETRRTRGLEQFAGGKFLGMARVNGNFGAEMERADFFQSFVRCPYGEPGGRLWVKETIRKNLLGEKLHGSVAHYVADGAFAPIDNWGWQRPVLPSIHMPMNCSRIDLEVRDIRVEHLQDITEAGAMAEGIHEVPFYPDDGFPLCRGYMLGKNDGKTSLHTRAVGAYQELWEMLNGPGSWKLNPFVWVVRFKRVVA